MNAATRGFEFNCSFFKYFLTTVKVSVRVGLGLVNEDATDSLRNPNLP